MSIAIKRNFTIPSTSAIGATELYLSSSVASTTIGTGALQVAGGAGVSGVISLGGELKLFNGSFYTGFDSAATANTTYIWPATSPSTGTSVLSSDAAGNLSWILMSASSSGSTLNGLTATTQYFSTSISGSGFTIGSIGSTHTYYIGLAGNASTGLISSSSQTLFGLKTFASGVAITSGIASTNTNTGDLVVSGGVGIGGSLWTSSANYSSISGVGISNGVVTGTLSGTATSSQLLATTTDTTSTLYLLGTRSNGGFAGTAIYVDTGISALGNTLTATTFSGTATTATNSANTNVTLDTTSTIYLTGSRSNSSTGSTPAYVLSGVSALGNTITATTFTGALSGTASSSALVNTDATTGTRYLLGTALNIASGSTQVSVGSGITIGNNLLTSGGIAVTNSTASSSTTSGALIITGGAGIAKTSYFGQSVVIQGATGSVSTTTGALVVTGGVGIGGTLTIGSDLISPSFVTKKLTTVTLGATINNYVEFLTITGGLNGGYNLLISINNNLAGTNIQTNKIYAISGNYGSSPDWKVVSPISEQASNSQSGAWELLILETQGDLVFRLRNKIGFVGTSTNSINIYNLDGNNLLTFTQSNTTGTDATAYTLSGGSPLMIIGANTQAGQGQVAIATPYAYSSTTALTVGGSAAITGSTASTSTASGALIITGGVGIGGSLWTSTTNFSSISGVGHSNSVITSGVWSGTAISAVNGGTGIASYTTGDILYATSSTTLGKIAAGTAGSVLTSAGAGSTPYWAVATAGAATGLTLNGLTASTQFFATSISGSGFTIGSTGSTHTYYIALAGNASTGLISGAAQTIFGLKTFASGLAITSGTASTNTTTGAFTVAGGVGITGQLSINTVALGSTGVSITPSMIFTGTAGTVITMSVLSDTTLAWEGSSGQLFSIDNNLSSGEIFSVSDISGLPIISASAGQSIYLNEFGGFTQVGNGLASTNATTGALRVIGGVGITGSLYLGSPLLIPSGGTGLTTYTTGDILYASSATTLAKITAGTAGSILTSAGTGATPYWAAATGSTLAIAGTNNGDIQYKSASALGASSALNFDASTSTFKLTGFPIDAVSGGSANVKLLGGSVAWNGNINGTMLAINTANTYIGDLFNAQIGGTSRFKVSYTGAISIGNSYTLPITDGTANQVLQTNGSGTISWADSVISSAQYNIGYYASAGAALTGSSTFTNNTSTGVVSIGHSTASTGFSTGALVVTGGVGIGGTLNIGVDLGISGLTTLTYTSEKLNTKTSATGTVTHDLSTGSIFYHSSISNNFTANITNVPTTNDRAIGVTLVLAQGVTPYMSTALQIDGSAQTIKWVNNSTPTGTASKVDIVGFSLIRTGSAWTVLGQYSTYG